MPNEALKQRLKETAAEPPKQQAKPAGFMQQVVKNAEYYSNLARKCEANSYAAREKNDDKGAANLRAEAAKNYKKAAEAETDSGKKMRYLEKAAYCFDLAAREFEGLKIGRNAKNCHSEKAECHLKLADLALSNENDAQTDEESQKREILHYALAGCAYWDASDKRKAVECFDIAMTNSKKLGFDSVYTGKDAATFERMAGIFQDFGNKNEMLRKLDYLKGYPQVDRATWQEYARLAYEKAGMYKEAANYSLKIANYNPEYYYKAATDFEMVEGGGRAAEYYLKYYMEKAKTGSRYEKNMNYGKAIRSLREEYRNEDADKIREEMVFTRMIEQTKTFKKSKDKEKTKEEMRRVFAEFGIEFYERYSPKILENIYRTATDPSYSEGKRGKYDIKTAFIVLNKSDYNNAFLQHTKYYEDLIKHGYNLIVCETDNENDLAKRIMNNGRTEARGELRQYDLVVIGGHGNAWSIDMGEKRGEASHIDFSDYGQAEFEMIKKMMAPDAVCVLISCSAGAKEEKKTDGNSGNFQNIMEMVASVTGTKTFGPDGPASFAGFDFEKKSGKIIGAFYHDAGTNVGIPNKENAHE